MKCFQCQRNFHTKGILISRDGDFVCSEKCEKEYEKEKAHFFNATVHDEKLTQAYLLGGSII